MLQVTCEGSPYEIGVKHGHICKEQVMASVLFTKELSFNSTHKPWIEVQEVARMFSNTIKNRWPRYYKEMEGIAEGSGCDLLDIIALNIRTEIAFGLATSPPDSAIGDGCTNAWAQTPYGPLQGQNWDWLVAQKRNLVQLTIRQHNYPEIQMITEAGMIGKIGLNSAGVAVTYNALYVRGANFKGLPSHLAMRMALESCSVGEACLAIQCQGGMAASAYILVGDRTTARGVEFSSLDIKYQSPNRYGYVAHTNHCLIAREESLDEVGYPADSIQRLARIEELLRSFCGGREAFSDLWKDEQDSPTGICRALRQL
ncbi:Hypothetical protein R9X50_00276500 [Acrodontium crateriforme]|uniref:Peptidase C45 hydrolase domain-containing protein n=1 Tax=Acrodontium crateriforme TaxID=150365 RepID=A0AAQ3M256_9PEZI|nr:Hypothetical protein R9X50_00276500 [Acrodontium crateriforme]